MGKIGAPYGNKNAEKWTFRKSVRMFNEAIELSNKEEVFTLSNGSKIKGYSFDFLGEIARTLGTSIEIFSHLAKKFPSLERLYSQLHTNIQSNCFSNTKKGLIKESVGIVNLKANYRWKDRFDATTDDKPFAPIKGITFKE
jgi:hypothetical protein